MAINVTPIPRLTTLTTPAFTLGTANAAGDAITAVASNSTLLAFDATVPASTGTAATGVATVAPRRDHVHASTISASQAEEEAGSSTTAFTSPGNQQYHPSAAKAWLYWEMTGAHGILASYGISGIADYAVGQTTITFSTAFSSVNYAPTYGNNWNRLIGGETGQQAAGSIRIAVTNVDGGALSDINQAGAAFFGDQ